VSLSDYQKAVLQEIGIVRYSLSPDYAFETKVEDTSKHPNPKTTAIITQETIRPDNDLAVAPLTTAFATDLLSLFSSDFKTEFKWLVGEKIENVDIQDNVLSTPLPNKLTTVHKKQIWKVLHEYFDETQWS